MTSTRLLGTALSAALVAAAAGQTVPFTAGNLVVVQAGDGTGTLDSSAMRVVLKEVSPLDGSVVQAILLPSTPAGANRAITISGTAASSGFISLSTDDRYLLLMGFDAAPGTLAVASTTPDLVARVVARVAMNGTVDTSTALADAFSGDNPRSAASVDGSAFWVGGTGSVPDSAGVRYCTLGATASTQLASDQTNIRVVKIFGGQLYATSQAGANVGLNTVGSGLATTSGQTTALLPGVTGSPLSSPPSPYDFFFSDASTLYLADDNFTANGGGIQKYTFDGSTWTLQYVLDTGSGPRGLAGRVDAGVVTLYATTAAAGTALVKIVDTGAGALHTTLLAPPNNTAFRGVAVIPGTPPPTGACCLVGGTCAVLTQAACTAQGGVYAGNGVTCASANCGNRTGACCLPNLTCTVLIQSQCSTQGGVYRGDGTGCATSACAPAFASGNLAVLQVGDGTAAVSNTATPVFVKEIRISDGAVIQSIGLPTAVATFGNRAATHVGNSTTEGELALSVDGRYLTCTGYNAAVGATNPANAGAATSRVVARINGNGVVDTSTAFLDGSYAGSNIRGAASTDGSAIWTTGTAGQPADAGVRYTTFGANSSLQLCSTPTNTRSVGIFNGQLYFSSASGAFVGVSSLGTGLPTTGGQTPTLLESTASPEEFFLADPNTLYVGLNSGTNVLEKWTNSGGVWIFNYALNNIAPVPPATAAPPMQHLTGVVSGGVVTIYGTVGDTVGAASGNRLVSVTDTGSSSAPYTVIATAAPNTWYKGVAQVPAVPPVACYPNCDHSTTLPCLNVADFTCFLNSFASGNTYANCDHSTQAPVLNVADFTCFLNSFAAGCGTNC